MEKLIDRPPRTMMEVYKTLPEGTLAELINDQIFMSPSPTSKHQMVLNAINFEFYTHFKTTHKGTVYIAPLDVYLDDSSNAVQPDIIVVLNENLSIIEESGHIHGVPDLLVEILSPGNKEHDLIRKKDLYENYGVKEYWIVDPETRLTLGYELVGEKYQSIHEGIGTIKSKLLAVDFSF